MDRRLREIVAVHFDPVSGTPFWLEKADGLGFDPREEVRTVADLGKLGLMDQAALCGRPLEAFIPRGAASDRHRLIVVQTSGTLGRPAWTAYDEEEFHAAFIEPFVVAARHVGFPGGGTWLYVGPTAPHVIGRAAEAIARATGSPAPFAVDFDAAWAKKLPADSFAAGRYLAHVVEQAEAIIKTQQITTIFTTPVVLRELSEAMTVDQRARIGGVHYGGMAIEPAEMQRFQTRDFPNAVHLSGYGNTLFGCCPELDVSAGRLLRYYPNGERLALGVLEGEGSDTRGRPCYGESAREGRLVFSRLDRTMLLANFAERDRVRLVRPPPSAPTGVAHLGVESPSPILPAPLAAPRIGLY